MSAIITVSQLNGYIKQKFQQDSNLAQVYVRGELSNCKLHSSGHIYFTLKDGVSAIRGVMFRSAAARLQFVPRDGMKLLVSGRVDVYERDGQYQLYAEFMAADGVGALALAFEQLKQKLQREGLFDPERKREIPTFPHTIGVVTAPTGAAVRDILNILGRRCPCTKVQLYPVLVQGEQAAAQIAQALDYFSESQVDTVIVGRGGGSMEDLWAFNEEQVVRAVARCKKPVISAVGHETDVTLCDFAADLRAPTPSAAAELAVPDVQTIQNAIRSREQSMIRAMHTALQTKAAALERIQHHLRLVGPERTVRDAQTRLHLLTDQLTVAMQRQMQQRQQALHRRMAQLDVLSPLSVLERGYAVLQDENGHSISQIKQVQVGQTLTAQLAQGKLYLHVDGMEEQDGEKSDI